MHRYLTILVLSAATTAAAQEHGPHEHGVGKLNVAVEGNVVEIELEVPGADIVGFEHAPSSDDEHAAVDAAAAKLADGVALFRLSPGAGCTLAEAEIESGLMEDHDDHGKDHDADHKEHAEGEEHEGHAEFHVHYHFDCTDPAALTLLETDYFATFPAARELETAILTDAGQAAGEMTPDTPRLAFPGH